MHCNTHTLTARDRLHRRSPPPIHTCQRLRDACSKPQTRPRHGPHTKHVACTTPATKERAQHTPSRAELQHANDATHHPARSMRQLLAHAHSWTGSARASRGGTGPRQSGSMHAPCCMQRKCIVPVNTRNPPKSHATNSAAVDAGSHARNDGAH